MLQFRQLGQHPSCFVRVIRELRKIPSRRLYDRASVAQAAGPGGSGCCKRSGARREVDVFHGVVKATPHPFPLPA